MYSLIRAVSYPRSQGIVPHAALRCSTAGFDDTYTRGLIRMKLDVPHGLHCLPPAPELRRTQDTANPSHKEHIYLYVLDAKLLRFLSMARARCRSPRPQAFFH
jgi:hypothetical protein